MSRSPYLALFIPIVVTISGCSSFGKSPTSDDHTRWTNVADSFDSKSKTFKNTNPNFQVARDYYAIFKGMLTGDQIRVPTEPLPEIKPDLEALIAPSPQLKFIWLGHSTFLINIEGKILLIDPVFETHASPVPIFGKRFQPALLRPQDLPTIDAILISHDHYDHLEMTTAKYFANTDTKYFVPLGIGARLRGWGVKPANIQEFNWWQEAKLDQLTLTCTPAQHFSGRSLFDGNSTLWASWAVKGNSESFYYSGDSGYFTHYKDIGEKLGPFKVTFLENGQYNELWRDVHQMPEQAVSAHIDLGGDLLVPVHWGAYELSFHDWFEPAERISVEAARLEKKLVSPLIGQLVDTSQDHSTHAWWRETPDVIKHLQALSEATHKAQK